MKIEVSTKGFNDIVNITDKVGEVVSKSNVKDGLAVIFVPHQTCAISTLEYEDGLAADLKEALEKVAPVSGSYQHDKKWGDGNGAAHIRASFLKPDLSVPVEDGRLVLGSWQQIILIDFDNRPRQRQIIIKIMEGK